MTKVVNIYKDKYDVYIGRVGKGQDGYFGNPIRLTSEAQRGSTLEAYEKYLRKRLETDSEFKTRFLELDGKTLGCFCKPKPCHGDVIVKLLEEMKK